MRPGLILYRIRSYTPLPLLALAMWFGDPTFGSVYLGLAVCALGEALRLWGVFTAGPLTRMQAAPGGDALVTHGPYAYLRNPLYLGNVIIYTGVGVMTDMWWIAAGAWAYFYIQYFFIIREEETYLLGHFGERYAVYCTNVGRLVPRVTPYIENGTPRATLWQSTRDALHSERRTFQAIVVATLLMGVMAWF